MTDPRSPESPPRLTEQELKEIESKLTAQAWFHTPTVAQLTSSYRWALDEIRRLQADNERLNAHVIAAEAIIFSREAVAEINGAADV